LLRLPPDHLDRLLTQVDNAAGLSLKNFSYDDAFRITGIADAAAARCRGRMGTTRSIC